MQTRPVTAPDGVQLAVYETGNPAGPEILFLHGFSQSALCWRAQMSDPTLTARFRMVAYDIRGHGASDQPDDPAYYAEDACFAADTQTVLTALNLKRPVLVGWSYAGRLINDYLRGYGSTGLAGINYVCARANNDPAFVGPGNTHLAAMTGHDLEAEITATIAFLHACFATPPDAAQMLRMLACNMRVRPATRLAHLSRPPDDGAVMAHITCPVLVTQGSGDQLVLPGLAQVIAATAPRATLSIYDGIGHTPFVEAAARFNAELAAFVITCAAS